MASTQKPPAAKTKVARHRAKPDPKRSFPGAYERDLKNWLTRDRLPASKRVKGA